MVSPIEITKCCPYRGLNGLPNKLTISRPASRTEARSAKGAAKTRRGGGRGERCRHATHRSREDLQREERAHGSAARGGPLDPRRRVRHDPRLVGCVKSTLLNLVVGLGPT